MGVTNLPYTCCRIPGSPSVALPGIFEKAGAALVRRASQLKNKAFAYCNQCMLVGNHTQSFESRVELDLYHEDALVARESLLSLHSTHRLYVRQLCRESILQLVQ